MQIAMIGQSVSTYVDGRERRAMLLQCVFGFGCIGFGFYAISCMVLADASVLIFLSPVLTFFLVRSSTYSFALGIPARINSLPCRARSFWKSISTA
jgi:hypothetical protein